MAYYTKVLQPDETVRIVGRLHWTIYLGALLLPLLAAIAALGSLWVPESDWRFYLRLVAAVIAAIGLLQFLAIAVRRHTTEIVVTDRRVIYKRGLLARHTVEINVSKIETVDVEQSIGARMFGYGTLMIHGTGSGFEPLARVGAPLAIRNAIVAG